MKMVKIKSSLMILIFSLYAGGGYAANIDLYGGWAVNIDGVVTDSLFNDPIPSNVDISAFNESTGVGSILVNLTAPLGAHSVDFFFDHEIDESINTYFNENGSASGSLVSGQSWEIDEPGYGSGRDGDGNVLYFGDIYWNLDDSDKNTSYFDNQIFYDWYDDQSLVNSDGSTPVKDDVSVAMGWNFNLGLDEMAIISMFVSVDQPGSGFYLAHDDLDSGDSIYFSSSLSIISAAAPVPAPSTLLLLIIGMLGIVKHKRSIF